MGSEEGFLLTPLLALGSGVVNSTRLEELLLQIVKIVYCRELRELVNHVLRSMEQDAGLGLSQHGGVVVGITRRNHPVIQKLKRPYGLAFGIALAQQVIGDLAVVCDFQLVTKQRRVTQFLHQGHGEFVEGVG